MANEIWVEEWSKILSGTEEKVLKNRKWKKIKTKVCPKCNGTAMILKTIKKCLTVYSCDKCNGMGKLISKIGYPIKV